MEYVSEMNEEEVKNKTVVPFLQSLGLNPGELSYEFSFSLRIGTNSVLVGSKTKRAAVSARLDMLVSRQNLPLMIVEVKAEDHDLTDDDRDQAISYARLVHPIVPYAWVTNGNQHQLWDSVTKEQVVDGKFKIRDGFTIALPPNARNEALEFFLGYSTENLLRFCKVQVDERMRPLLGSPHDITKKYIPELTVRRTDAQAALKKFESSDSPGFLLLAESGGGKTSALCDYTLDRLRSGKPTLFFPAGTLGGDLIDGLVTEFNWIFTTQVSAPTLVKQLERVARGNSLVIVLDAVDEWIYSAKAQSLLDLLRHVHGSIKVVFSCKSGAWDSICCPTGSDLGFASYLFCLAATDEGKPTHFVLTAMTAPEFFGAVRLYREVFGVTGGFEDQVLAEARKNPFLLRVFFAVARETGQTHLTFSSREFFEKYFELICSRTGRKHLATTQLIKIAASFATRNRSTIPEIDLNHDLGLSGAECMLDAFFEQDVLVRTSQGVSFYFQQLRDYLISFHVKRWPEAEKEELSIFFKEPVLVEAFAFFLRYATLAQWKIVAEIAMPNAERYLQKYIASLETHFPALRPEFEPRAPGPIGFIGEFVVPTRMIYGHGFCAKKTADPEIHLLPTLRPFADSNLFHLRGAGRLGYNESVKGFFAFNVAAVVVENELIRQLELIRKERRFYVAGCPSLRQETVIALLYGHRNYFPALFNEQSGELRFPLKGSEVWTELRKQKLICHFEHLVTERKIREGSIREKWQGEFSSYSPSFTPTDREWINNEVVKALAQATNPVLRAVLSNLREIEDTLKCVGIGPNQADFEVRAFPWVTEYFLERSTEEQRGQLLRHHFERLFSVFLKERQSFLRDNFPTLQQFFTPAEYWPQRMTVGVDSHGMTRHPYHVGRTVIVIEKLPPGATNELVVLDAKDIDTHLDRPLKVQGREVTPIQWSVHPNIGEYIYNPRFRAPLHEMVYATMNLHWSDALNGLRAHESVPIKQSPLGRT